MAIDSRNKRFSLVGLAFPAIRILPDPDGVVDTQDRAHFEYLYAGITLAAPGGIVSGISGMTIRRRSM